MLKSQIRIGFSLEVLYDYLQYYIIDVDYLKTSDDIYVYTFFPAMVLTQDQQQTANLVFQISLTSFKVAMACLLSVFVPQDCNGRDCELEDNFKDLHPYNAFVLAWNLATLVMFVYVFWFEGKREVYMISHFDVSKDHPDTYLPTLLQNPAYSKMKLHLEDSNRHYASIYRWLSGLILSNVLFSGVLLFHLYYRDFRTITVFLSNIALIADRVWKGYCVSQECLREGYAISIYQTEPTYFNVVDENYRVSTPMVPSLPPNDFSEETKN